MFAWFSAGLVGLYKISLDNIDNSLKLLLILLMFSDSIRGLLSALFYKKLIFCDKFLFYDKTAVF